jgi:hypothetical protein
MRTVASALAWDLWQRNRGSWLGCGIGLAGATVLAWTARWMQTGTDTAATVGYLALVAGLFVCFGCLHFTEGGRRGGFGTFPIRLFHLPVSTKQLVAWPMVHGAAVVAGWYLVVAWLVLAPLDRRPPCLWPCLYLVSGMTWFQAIVWAFPGSRYGKLALLCLVASGLAFGWMFFLPHMIEGTLADWGYTGPVASRPRLAWVGLESPGNDGANVRCAFAAAARGRRRRSGFRR